MSRFTMIISVKRQILTPMKCQTKLGSVGSKSNLELSAWPLQIEKQKTYDRIWTDFAPCPASPLTLFIQKFSICWVHNCLCIFCWKIWYHILSKWWCECAPGRINSIALKEISKCTEKKRAEQAKVEDSTLVPPMIVTNLRFGLSMLWASMTFRSMRKFVATSSISSSIAVKTGKLIKRCHSLHMGILNQTNLNRRLL